MPQCELSFLNCEFPKVKKKKGGGYVHCIYRSASAVAVPMAVFSRPFLFLKHLCCVLCNFGLVKSREDIMILLNSRSLPMFMSITMSVTIIMLYSFANPRLSRAKCVFTSCVRTFSCFSHVVHVDGRGVV